MGLLSNRKEKREKQEQAATELRERRDRLVAQFERGLRPLAPVFEEAMQRGCGRNIDSVVLNLLLQASDRDSPNIEQMLLADFINIVNTIGIEMGNPSLSPFKSGGGVIGVAFAILKKVFPEGLPKPGDFCPALAAMNFTDDVSRLGVELSEFTVACKSFQTACQFGSPGMLLVMQEYDRTCGTLHSCAVADLFLAFMLELEQPPVALKGTRIMEAYISALREYLAKKPSGREVPASV